MQVETIFSVVSVQRLEGGLHIEFDDGTSGLYSGEFLHAFLSFRKQIKLLKSEIGYPDRMDRLS